MWRLWALAIAALVLAIIGVVFGVYNYRKRSSGRRGPPGPRLNMSVFSEAGTTTEFVVPKSSGGKGYVVMYGGGGGGGGGVIGPTGGEQFGGGGGAGAYVYAQIKAEPGSTLSITVGQGGAAGLGTTGVAVNATEGSGAGSAGTSSIISGLLWPDPVLVAGGGQGAPGLGIDTGGTLSFAQVPAEGGAGGIASPAAGPNGSSYVAVNGQPGSPGTATDSVAGFGGACPNGGGAGVSGLLGLLPYVDPAFGTAGGTPGGGGGGGGFEAANSTPYNGGPGANGLVYVFF
jgi:hypothetical protein